MTLFELPIFRCHKRVGAARIVAISPTEQGGAVLTLDTNPGELRIQVDAAWIARNFALEVGGFFVQYIESEDHYTAFSPALPFFDGYSREEAGEVYGADSVINLGQDIVDIKTILSQIETMAVNDPHTVKPLVDQANEKLDALIEFFVPAEMDDTGIPGGTEVDAADVPNQPVSSPPDPPPAPGPVPGTPAPDLNVAGSPPAEQAQAAESAPDGQQEQPVEQAKENVENAAP